MRKKLSTLALLLLVATGSFHAYGFSAVTSSGHTLNYAIFSGTHNVEVQSSNVSGALVIDSTVTYNNITYRVTSIAYQAFSGRTGLTSVTIPSSVTSIGTQTFSGCRGLTSVNIPNSVTSIGTQAFPGCTSLTSVTIPNSVTSIGNWAFDGCTSLTSLVFNATNCTSIGGGDYYSFTNCPISSVTFGSTVQIIPDYLLSGCTGLTSVTIPNSVTSIGDNAFSGCTGLTSIVVANGNRVYDSRNNCNAIIETNTNTLHTGCQNTIIPTSVTSIGDFAFCGCSSLTSVTIPNSVTAIGFQAFSGCLRLTSVSLGEGVVNIGSQAFKDCGIIGELVIPQSVTTIGNNGFRNCYGINEITCLGRVAPTLGDYAFEGVDTGITVNIPCGTTNLYAGRWSYFHHFNEIPFLFNVASDNLAYGTVQMLQEPSCDDPVAIVKATARNGYHFDHWSDGSTQNPYTCVVTGSMTLTAFFASDHGQTGIEDADGEADGPNVYADGGRIVVTGAEGEDVSMYDMMGRRIATRQEYNGPVVIEVPAAGTYLIRIGTHPARRVVVVR